VKIRNKQKDERGSCDLELIIEKLKKENYDLKKTSRLCRRRNSIKRN
jgi:hypothetical protein